MILNERGLSVYTIISIVLFLALVFILALPNFFNIDKAKNEEDCITNMKSIWVASTDYMKDYLVEFDGDLTKLKTTPRKTGNIMETGKKGRSFFLDRVFTCPGNRGSEKQYIVFSKFLIEEVHGTERLNYGTIVLCPNLGRYPKHQIPQSFFDNMESTEIQNYLLDDMDFIISAAGPDRQHRFNLLKQYIEIWKTDATALERVRANNLAIKNQIIPPEEPVELLSE